MSVVKILPDIYSVGVVDWDMRTFHGHTYTTNRGTTYNSYLIVDEKIALVDAVYAPFTQELIDNIKSVVSLDKIDYIIVNHLETDHTGALPELVKLMPKVKILCTEKCKEGLYKHYYMKADFQVVKTGDELKLGKRTLQFIEAPMIHWPDSMFTYCPEESLLMPNDAFGQHFATAERFDDEVDQCALQDESQKYYANILWPLSPIIFNKIQDLHKLNIPIKMIAPSHGIIWRRDPGKIVNSYIHWAKNETIAKVVIVFESMWGSTDKMARKMLEGLVDSGVEVKLFDVAVSDRTEIINEMLEAKGFLFGSSTHDNDMLPSIAGFLEFVKGLKVKNRLACAFGSYGWAGGAVKEIEKVIQESGIELASPGLAFKYVPDELEIKQCYEYGKSFAAKIKA